MIYLRDMKRFSTKYEAVVSKNIIVEIRTRRTSQAKVAESIDMDRTQFNSALHGRLGSVINLVPKLARLWGLDETYFFRDPSRNFFSLPDDEHSLIDSYRVLKAAGIGQELTDYADYLVKADVDFKSNTLIARDTKSGRDKVLAMPVWLRDMLLDIVEENDSPFVFVSKHTGRPWLDVTWPLRKAAVECGITKHVHLHLFRHSIATHLTDLNTSLRTIQSFLGHSDIQMSAWYAQVSAANKQGVAGRIDALVQGDTDCLTPS